MKAAIASTIAVVALASTAVFTTGSSAQPQASNVDVSALQKQLNQTNARLAKLDARVKKLESRSNLLIRVAGYILAGVACEATLTADTFQATWGAIDQVAQAAQSKTYFGPQTPVNDQRSCFDLGVERRLPGSAPSLAPFTRLIDFFYGG
jgi:hypothetical protein